MTYATFVSNAPAGSSCNSRIELSAGANEVGIYNPNYFQAVHYSVGYTFIIHPPIEYDSSNAHLNLKLAGQNHPRTATSRSRSLPRMFSRYMPIPLA